MKLLKNCKRATALLMAGMMCVMLSNGMTGNVLFTSMITAEASDYSYSDWVYNLLEDGTVEIAEYNGEETELEIPEEIDGKSVTSIGDNAFEDFDSLTSIDIPEGVTNIGEWAFYGCSSLTSIFIPEDVTNIGQDAFSECSCLKSIQVSKKNNHYASVEGVLFNKATTELILCPANIEGKYIIPNVVKKIGDNSFADCSKLTEIIIPEGVTSIGKEAFHSCSNLTSINIPKGVTSIEKETFSWCSSLKSVKLPEGVTNIEKNAFSECSSLTSIEIPEGVICIKENTFSSCSSLTSIKVPRSVTSIGKGAFSGCKSLTSIEIPEGVTSIEDGTFAGCNALICVEIPNSVTGIGWCAFSNCKSLTSIEIPESVTNIDDAAFFNCRSLKSITIPKSVTNIEEDTFYECSSLKRVTIPESVTNIGNKAFYKCSSLISIKIPESVTAIGDDVFYGCSSLVSVEIPNSTTKISDIAFDLCNNLIIYSLEDAYAHTYAVEEEIEWKSLDEIPNFDYADIASAEISISDLLFVYDGMGKKPNVIITDGARNLVNEVDFSLEYKNNINAGTAIVIITGKGDYTGTITKTFTIKKALNKITATGNHIKIASSKAQSFNLNAKAKGGKITYKSNSKSVSVNSVGKVTIAKNFAGKATVTITAGDANYKTVTKTVRITVKPAKTKVISAKNSSSRKAIIMWSKLSYVSGYQIQYGIKSSMSGAKTITVNGASKVSKVITGLAKGKTYYLRIRTYKTVGNTKYYSIWSEKKRVRISK